jgi:hypothetical protein
VNRTTGLTRWRGPAQQWASLGVLALWSLLTGLAPQDEQLLQAARDGNLEQVEALLRQGATVTVTDENGLTPLHEAAGGGHEAVARLLLEQGANVAARDQNYQTPLHWAARESHAGIIALLLAHDAYVGVKDKGWPDSTGETYLIPYDGDPAILEATGYSGKRLYAPLGTLSAKEVVVMLDSCCSVVGGRSVIAKGLRPMVLSVENPVLAGGKIVVLAASRGATGS